MDSNNTGEVIIDADEHAKIGWYDSLYSSQYLKSKFDYESRRRKWRVIPLADNHFTLIDSNDVMTPVYYSYYVKNCDCKDFINSETGVCQHVYTIENNIHLFRKSIANDNLLVYVDYERDALCKLARRSEVIVDLDLARIRNDNPDCTFTPAVEGFIRRQLEKQNIIFEVDLGDFSLFKHKNVELYRHQKESINRMLQSKRTVLTLKMGLGKTICALYCCGVLADKKSVIIVCPNTLKFQWQKEIDRFNLGTSIVISKGQDLDLYKDQRFLIISYEMLNRHSSVLLKNYDIAIIDEIQKIKNGESVTWETIRCIKSEFVFSLSGTPIQNTISDLISVLRVISPGEFNPEWKFYERYCNLTRTRLSGWNVQNLPRLKERLKRYVINPIINWSDFKLPEKTAFLYECTMDEVQTEIHDNAFASAKVLLSKSYNYPLTFAEKAVLNSLLLKCRRAVSDARLLDARCSKSDRFTKIENLLVEKVKAGKVVVYSDWIDCLNLLMPRLDQEGIGYVKFTGELTDKAKNKNLDAFISDPTIKVFLSTDSGGLGVDGLQLASSTIIHVEDIWNPMKLAQREGRLIRALQPASNVEVYSFNSNSGIEEMLKANKVNKYKIIDDIMSN